MTKWFSCLIMPVRCLIKIVVSRCMSLCRYFIFLVSFLLVFPITVCGHAYERLEPHHALIDSLLQAYQLPLHYAYLPLLQTNCDVLHSSDYSGGAWGLGAAAARHYGLQIRPGYDERHDMRRSTEAAVYYLSDLYRHYAGDSEKTLTQFMRCASTSHSKNDFSADFLLRRLAEAHPEERVVMDSTVLREITIEKSVPMREFCRLMHIDSVELMSCNPSLRPKVRLLHAASHIYLPIAHEVAFESISDTLYTYAIAEQESSVTVPTEAPKPEPDYIIYRVRAGDTLGHIAMRYHVGVSHLKRWNHLRSDLLQIGQRLKIYKR